VLLLNTSSRVKDGVAIGGSYNDESIQRMKHHETREGNRREKERERRDGPVMYV
jgi:hypothetical protein